MEEESLTPGSTSPEPQSELARERAAHAETRKRLLAEFSEHHEALASSLGESAESATLGELVELIGGENGMRASKEAAWAIAKSRLTVIEKQTAELERVREELATAEDNATRYYREAGELRAQARARRVPTREAIADMLDTVDFHEQGASIRAADAVLCLFAEAEPSPQPALVERAAMLPDCANCGRKHLDGVCASPQPGGFLDALTRRVEALEVAYGTIIAEQDKQTPRGRSTSDEPDADIGIYNCANRCGAGVLAPGRLCGDCRSKP